MDFTGCKEIEEIEFIDGMSGKNSGWNNNQDFKIGMVAYLTVFDS